MPLTSFRVTITALNASAPADGFVDHKRIESYLKDNPALVLTLTQTVTKERANQRYLNLINSMQMAANVYVRDIVATGASATAAPTSFAFTADVEHGTSALVTRDETNNGALLSGIPALRRLIARSFLISSVENSEIYDPTKTSTTGNATAWVRFGHRIVDIDVGAPTASLATAEAAITITAL